MPIVQSIDSRSVNTKYGPKDTYSLTIDGVKYSLGFKKPKCKVGDDVSFVHGEGKYGPEIDSDTLKVVTAGPGTVIFPGPAALSKAPPAAKPFPIPFLHGDRAIVRQNSVTNAVKMVIDSGSFNTNEMTADELVSSVIKIAQGLEAYSCGDLDAEAAKSA